jgi:hypothetical protein
VIPLEQLREVAHFRGFDITWEPSQFEAAIQTAASLIEGLGPIPDRYGDPSGYGRWAESFELIFCSHIFAG